MGGSFSVAAWVYKENNNNTGFIRKGRDVNSGSFYLAEHAFGITYSYGNYLSANGDTVSGSTWHHVVGIFDGNAGEIRYYKEVP